MGAGTTGSVILGCAFHVTCGGTVRRVCVIADASGLTGSVVCLSLLGKGFYLLLIFLQEAVRVSVE